MNLFPSMENDFMKRGYLLPEGCKDLIDVLTLKPQQQPRPPSFLLPAPPPLIVGEIVVPERTSVLQLAALLGQKPFQIVADVMQLGIFATVTQPLGFQIISSVARKYGFIAKRAA